MKGFTWFLKRLAVVLVLTLVVGTVIMLASDFANAYKRPIIAYAPDGSISWVTVVNDDGTEVKYTEADFDEKFGFAGRVFRYEYLPEDWRPEPIESAQAASAERAPWDVEPIDPPQE